jgi:hypothetical protein
MKIFRWCLLLGIFWHKIHKVMYNFPIKKRKGLFEFYCKIGLECNKTWSDFAKNGTPHLLLMTSRVMRVRGWSSCVQNPLLFFLSTKFSFSLVLQRNKELEMLVQIRRSEQNRNLQISTWKKIHYFSCPTGCPNLILDAHRKEFNVHLDRPVFKIDVANNEIVRSHLQIDLRRK